MRFNVNQYMLQEGFPVVISSDDPATWEASALTYDFYEAFMGLAGRDMDLRLLKKLVFSSMEDYAATTSQDERDKCVQLMRSKWDAYMQQVLDEVGTEEEICKHRLPLLSIIH